MKVLDSSAASLLDLYEHAPCGFHSLDANGTFVRINDTELNWLGYERTEVVGRMRLNDILTPEGRKLFSQSFPTLKATGTLRDLEFDFVRKNGTLMRVLVSATAVHDRDGNFIMSRSVVYDLTNRRRADTLFHAILEAAADAILICNQEGLIVLGNAQVESVFGYRPAELQGKPIEVLLPERFRNNHTVYRKAFFERPQKRPMSSGLELPGLRKDGTEVPVEISLSPLETDDGLSTVAVVRDVTDRRLAADELRKSEAQYHSVVRVMAEGVVVQERNGMISACNESAQRILGLTDAQIKGRTSVDPRWRAIHEDGSPFPGNSHPSMLALRTGERQSNVCMGVHKPDGSLTWILINAEPVCYPETHIPRAVVTTFTDISDRKRLEEELLQSQKLDAIGRLAGGIAHDFNNVLGVIIGHSDLLAEEFADNERVLRRTRAIRKSADHAVALTRQLLAFGRKQVMQPTSLNLNEIVEHTSEMLQRIIGENMDLSLHLGSDVSPVYADPVQLERVLLNLCVNARDAMPGGGKLTITTANVELDHESSSSDARMHPGPYVMLSVSDNGQGMDQQTLARVFEPFFTTKELGRGTGLGLSIIYGIVRQSGGHIQVESEPGQGTTFRVYLPSTDSLPAEKNTRTPASPEPVEGGTETILLVEDDETVREVVASMLQPSGYNVLVAASARDAVDKARNYSGRIDLLLTDVVLGSGMEGPQLATELRSSRPGMKVLFMSGYSEALILSSASSKPADLIEKPFSADSLCRRIRTIFNSQTPTD